MCHYPACQNKAINDPDHTSKPFPKEPQRVRWEVFSQFSQLFSTISGQKHSLCKLKSSLRRIGPVSDLKHVYIRNGQTSVLYNNNLCEAFTIKRFSEIKTFHRYHHALKKKCLMTTYASLLLPVLIFCGSTSESIWLNWSRWLWNGRPFDRLNGYVWNNILAYCSTHYLV